MKKYLFIATASMLMFSCSGSTNNSETETTSVASGDEIEATTPSTSKPETVETKNNNYKGYSFKQAFDIDATKENVDKIVGKTFTIQYKRNSTALYYGDSEYNLRVPNDGGAFSRAYRAVYCNNDNAPQDGDMVHLHKSGGKYYFILVTYDLSSKDLQRIIDEIGSPDAN